MKKKTTKKPKTVWSVLFKILKLAGLTYVILFLVFYFDLDGKLLYCFVEPNLNARYNKMQRADNTVTPYDMKEPIRL